MIRNATSALLLSSVIALGGCSESFPEITDVEGARTLAVHLGVVGDPERASPAPGESVRVELVIADRGPRLGRSFEMVACIPTESDLDVGVCRTLLPGGTIAGSTIGADPIGAPSFELLVPDAATLGDARELLVHGAVCAGGALRTGLPLEAFPESFETDDPCLDPEDEGEFVVFRIPLEGTSPNHQPQIASLRLDDASWDADAPASAPESGCVGGGLPTFPSDRIERRISVALSSDSREAYAKDDGTQTIERPYLGFHATDGDFEGAYALFDDDAPREIVFRTRDDRAPRPVPDDGRLVRFFFVLRDGRGGTAIATRAICLIP